MPDLMIVATTASQSAPRRKAMLAGELSDAEMALIMASELEAGGVYEMDDLDEHGNRS